ncbi:hypothetical protein ACQ3HE_06585 [Plantibacter auratus]|uniref:hypothetical protein n=1 Tax=Plantibacter auratus TaxID=272914 RepID=UPI003D33EAF6
MTNYLAQPPAQKRRVRWWWIAAPVAAALLSTSVIFGAITLIPNDTKTATEKCKADVLEQLKSPSTANFADVDRMSEEDEREFVRDLPIRDGENPVFVIEGAVDSQNSFGAVVRSTFTCRAQKFGPVWTTNTALSE